MRILVLGHKGMLGNAVYRYIDEHTDHSALFINKRYPDTDFTDAISSTNPDVIINCIGAIPQKKPSVSAYQLFNIELPIFLEKLGILIIHPSTDCEFEGTTSINHLYSKADTRDATDIYGESKAIISSRIEKEFKDTKIIRTSIIGHELSSNLSLLDWFLSQEGTVRGYSNHYWNGITTLEWAKQSLSLLELPKDKIPPLTQLASPECLSKHDILMMVHDIYQKKISVVSFEMEKTVNKCLSSDKPLPSLNIQLKELREFYHK